jgi:hypothetical protein
LKTFCLKVSVVLTNRNVNADDRHEVRSQASISSSNVFSSQNFALSFVDDLLAPPRQKISFLAAPHHPCDTAIGGGTGHRCRPGSVH